jgi:uncharacterized protein YjiS (DUF1127 family)
MTRIGLNVGHIGALPAALAYYAAAAGYRASGRKDPSATRLLTSLAEPNSWLRAVNLWFSRISQRQALAELDERLLRDIGVTRYDAEAEIAKPFWR